MREGNHMRAVLIIVIENCKNQTKSGYLQSLYQEKSFCFHGLDHMLLLMEECRWTAETAVTW